MTTQFDTLIIGGGLAGNIMAIALAQSGLSVAILDRDSKPTLIDSSYDGRSSAIAYGAQQVLDSLGIWPHMAEAAQPIKDIRISDAGRDFHPSALFLHYDHTDLKHPLSPAQPDQNAPFGWIVENRQTRLALQQVIESLPLISQYNSEYMIALEQGAHRVTVTCQSGQTLSAPLVIGADGRGSQTRQLAGIKHWHHAYDQSGIVCSVTHPYNHDGTAHEHFLPSGPFAVLPMCPDDQGRYRSSIVWTEKTKLVSQFMALSDQAFSDEMTRRFGDSLGPLTLQGGRWHYPLSVMHAERYYDNRLVLIGDAAHGIHPISGQGLNLGIKDIAALAELLIDHARQGGDIGDPAILQTYEQWRRPDNLALITITDGLNRLFSNDIAPLRHLRDVGMVALGSIPPLKKLFMRHAMGISGNTPRLIQGRKL